MEPNTELVPVLRQNLQDALSELITEKGEEALEKAGLDRSQPQGVKFDIVLRSGQIVDKFESALVFTPKQEEEEEEEEEEEKVYAEMANAMLKRSDPVPLCVEVSKEVRFTATST